MISARSGLPVDMQTLWFVTRSAGLVSLVLLSLTVALGIAATSRAVGGRVGPRFVHQGLHRNVSLIGLSLLVVHIGTAVADDYVSIRLRDVVLPVGGLYRPVWLGAGAAAIDVSAHRHGDQPVPRTPRSPCLADDSLGCLRRLGTGRRARPRHRVGRQAVMGSGDPGRLRRLRPRRDRVAAQRGSHRAGRCCGSLPAPPSSAAPASSGCGPFTVRSRPAGRTDPAPRSLPWEPHHDRAAPGRLGQLRRSRPVR